MVSIKQNSENFVHAVCNTTGISLSNTIGTVSTAGALNAFAKDCANNAKLIGPLIAANASKSETPSSQSNLSSVSLDVKTSSMMGSTIGAGVVLGLALINPVFGAGAGAVMAVSEAASFALGFAGGHAGVKGSKPAGGEEFTLTNSIASFDKSGEMVSYTPYCEQDVTYNVSTGQKQAGPVDSKVLNAINDLSPYYSEKQMSEDTASVLQQNKDNFLWAQNKLEMLGRKDQNNNTDFDAKGLNIEQPKLAVIPTAPKAFAFG